MKQWNVEDVSRLLQLLVFPDLGHHTQVLRLFSRRNNPGLSEPQLQKGNPSLLGQSLNLLIRKALDVSYFMSKSKDLLLRYRKCLRQAKKDMLWVHVSPSKLTKHKYIFYTFRLYHLGKKAVVKVSCKHQFLVWSTALGKPVELKRTSL